MTNSFKYGLIGFTGRLGREVVSTFAESKNELVFKFDENTTEQKDTPQILIDCSLPVVFERTIEFVNQFNAPLVIATTGLSEQQLNTLKNISEKVSVVQSYNFSVGVQILLKLTETAKEKLGDWDIEIIESHHRFKKDKPSGTAKMLRDLFPDKKVPISSLRLGNVVGEHTIYFGGMGEVLSLSHIAISRRTFAEGILKSAEFALSKDKGFYSFSDVIFNK